jgi:hypothetical protein
MSSIEAAKESLARLKRLHYYAEAEGFENIIWKGLPMPVAIGKKAIVDLERLITNTYDPNEYTD